MKRSEVGFSLLELLVALVIMAIGLAMVYRSTGGSARQVQTVTTHQKAQLLIASLLTIEAVPPAGIQENGVIAGLRWSLSSEPYDSPLTDVRVVPLHVVHVAVRWDDALAPSGERVLTLTTLRPQRQAVKPRTLGRI